MSELVIYDRFGEPVDSNLPTDEKYRTFDRTGVLLYTDSTGSNPEVISAFRAHDRPGGRSNRFFAKFVGDSVETLFEECRRAVERRTDELGWKLDTKPSDVGVNTFLGLSDATPGQLGLEERADQVGYLLHNKRQVEFGVRDVSTGVAVIKQMMRDKGQQGTFAMGTNGRVPSIENALLVLKLGASGAQEIRPLGDTKAAMDEARKEWEQHFLSTRMTNIKETIVDAVNEIRQSTNVDDDRIRHELKSSVDQGFRQARVGVRAITQAELDEMENQQRDLKSERDDYRYKVQRLQDRPNQSLPVPLPLVGLGIVIVLILAFVGGAVFAPPFTSIPVVGQYLPGGGDIVWTEDPSYNTSEGTLSLAGTAPSGEFVVVNVSQTDGNESVSTIVPIQNGSFELERRVDHLFGTNFESISEGQYRVTASAGAQETDPMIVTIAQPATIEVYQPVEGQVVNDSELVVRGVTNANTLSVTMVGGDQQMDRELRAADIPRGRFEVRFDDIPVAETYQITIVARRGPQNVNTETVTLSGASGNTTTANSSARSGLPFRSIDSHVLSMSHFSNTHGSES